MCECNEEQKQEFLKDIERLEKQERETRDYLDPKIDTTLLKEAKLMGYNKVPGFCELVELEGDVGMDSIHRIRKFNKRRKEIKAEICKQEGMSYPSIFGEFYPKGSRYSDSFGFRIQIPGECDECYKEFQESYKRAMSGTFD